MQQFVSYDQLLTEAVYGLDEAEFSYMPKFRADPKTKGIVASIDKASAILKSNNINDEKAAMAYKGALDDVNAASSDILQLVSDGYMIAGVSIGLGPLLGVVLGLAWHGLQRLIRYYQDKNNEKAAIEVAKRQIGYLDKVIKTANGSEKKKAQDIKAKLEAEIKELEK